MILSGQYLDHIIRELTIIRYEIASRNQLNLTDDNIHMQNFMCGILNIVYGYSLVNLNSAHENFPGLDLGDEELKIGFQITATKTGQKIKDTIDTCIKHPCCHKYSNIKVFILTSKQSQYTIDYTNDIFSFNPTTDILDFDDIFKEISSCTDVDKKRQLYEYIQKEIPTLRDYLHGNSNDNDAVLTEIFFEIKNNETIIELISSYFDANHLSEIVLYPNEEKEWWVFDDGTPARSVDCSGNKGIHSLRVTDKQKNKIPLIADAEIRKDVSDIYERYNIYLLANGFDKATAKRTSEIMKEIRTKYSEWL